MMKHRTPTAPSEPSSGGGTQTLYPELPEAFARPDPRGGDGGLDHTYRLQEIAQQKRFLEAERDERRLLHKKYSRGVNALDGVDTALLAAGMGLGIGGVGLLSTIIAAPVVLGLEVAALACGGAGLTARFVSRRVAVKAKKHYAIKVLAESKLNTLAELVSTALIDGRVSDVEFRLILDETRKYVQMKAEIRAEAGKTYTAALDEDTKRSLIQRGRDETRANFIKKLTMDPV